MFRKLIPFLLLLPLLTACSGGDSYGASCSEENKGSQTSDGQDLLCKSVNGQLIWQTSGDGQEAGVINRTLWDYEKQGCPEAIAETGFETAIINNNEVFSADARVTDQMRRGCKQALENGRTRNYSLETNGVDYVTQIEKSGYKLPTLNDSYSKGKCEKRDVTIKNSFTKSADNVKLLWPLGVVSTKHIIPTDHDYVHWKTMKPAFNEVIAPADGFVVNIEGTVDDFRIVIELSCDHYMSFGHLDEFAGVLADQKNEFNQGHRGLFTRIPIKAGDVLATAGEVMTDLWYWDQSKKITGVREANYYLHNQMNIYAVDPFLYLKDPVSVEIAKKFVGESVKDRGVIGKNVQGTAQGGWYQLDTLGEHGPLASWLDHIDIYAKDMFGPWDGSLSWAPDALDPKTFLFAVGSFNKSGSINGITKSNISPLNLKPGSEPVVLELYDFDYKGAKGELFSRDDITKREFTSMLTAVPTSEKLGVVVLQLVDENTLKVEKRPGASASTSPKFTGEPLIYKR